MTKLLKNPFKKGKIKEIYIGKDVDVKVFDDYMVVRINSVPDKEGFGRFLNGQTMPYLEGEEDPFGWAYMGDYLRYVKKYPVID